MSKPLLSCLMPTTAAREGFARLAVEWFSAQTWRDRAELIVIEDGDDEPMDLGDGMRRFITLGRQTKGAKLNMGVEISEGEIIVCWDDDDYFGPNRIARQVQPILDGTAMATILRADKMWVAHEQAAWRITRPLVPSHDGTLTFHKALFRLGVQFPDEPIVESGAFIIRAIHDLRCPVQQLENCDDFLYVRHPSASWQVDPRKFADPIGGLDGPMAAAANRYTGLLLGAFTDRVFTGTTLETLEDVIPDRLDLEEAKP